jgi:hypothetical protein
VSCFCQIFFLKIASPMKLLKLCFYMEIRWDETKHSSFSQLHVTLVGLVWDYVRIF